MFVAMMRVSEASVDELDASDCLMNQGDIGIDPIRKRRRKFNESRATPLEQLR
jgi:hypothetical protein